MIEVVTAEPISAQTARSLLSAIAVNGASSTKPGIAMAMLASSTRPNVRHQKPVTSRLERDSARVPRTPSITTACGTKYQRTYR